MAFPRGSVLDAVSLVIEMFALIACLRAAEAPARMVKVITVMAALAVLVGISPWYSGLDIDRDLVRGVTLVLVVTALPSITLGLIRQLKRDQTVNVRTIFGALCAYVLLIIAFASAFGVSAAIEAGPFFGQGASDSQYGDYVYFAVTTVTTLGIGDLTPATAFGRSLTGMLALIGQIYVVTVVALIVGNLGRGVLGKARNEGEED